MVVGETVFRTRLARDAADLRAAQRLRYSVFVEEMGSDGPLVDHAEKLEIDAFDAHAEHLLLINAADDVVGTYRFMGSQAAQAAGGFYSEGEFDLTALRQSGLAMLELGRSCVAAPYRSGLGLYHLWHGLARIVMARGVDVLFGTASFPGTDPQAHIASLSYLHHNHMTPAALRPVSRQGHDLALLPPEETDRRAAMLATPALIKSYLRLGGTIGEGVFVDRAFNTTDVLLVLNIGQMTERQRMLYTQGPGR